LSPKDKLTNDKQEDQRFVQETQAGARSYRASGPLIISGVFTIALSAGLATHSDLVGSFVCAIGILLLLAGVIKRGN
jgi:drug/metabolite transporter superfamily protein YnfA